MSRQAAFPVRPDPPRVKREERGDPYGWLRDPNWSEVLADPSCLDPATGAHLLAENAYAERVIGAPFAALRARLLSEMVSRIDPREAGVAVLDGPYAYYHRYAPDKEYRVYARTMREQAYSASRSETVLADGNVLAGEGYFSFGQVRHSPDHRCVAYTVDRSGSEYHELVIGNIVEGTTLATRIDDAAGDMAWGSGSDHLYWVRRDSQGRPSQVMRWRRETGRSESIYIEEDPGYFVSLDRTMPGAYVVIHSADHTTSECHLLASDDPEARPEVVLPRRAGVEYDLDEYGKDLILRTNADGAEDFKLVVLGRDGEEFDLVGHCAGCLIEDFAVFADHVVRVQRRNARLEVVVRDRCTDVEHIIDTGCDALDVAIDSGFEHDTGCLRLSYSSPGSPRAVADYDMAGRTFVLRKSAATHWGHDPEAYITDLVEALSEDGSLVPVTVTRHRDTAVDGSAPLLLYGYGSYGITVADSFRSEAISLMDRGFVYANVHVRGSKARGYGWYRDGKLGSKPNSFTDFVSAGRHLVEAGYTSAGRIVALGRSAGGLLVGAAVNLDPDLFAAVIAGVPFVDVLNTMSDPDLPLTPPEWPEWGNPLTSDADRELIAGYCPYSNVSGRVYPPILATGSVSDPRVGYWEPAKWIARLRHEAPQGGPYVLMMNMSAGHGGQSGRYRRLQETASEYAFALAAVGKSDA